MDATEKLLRHVYRYARKVLKFEAAVVTIQGVKNESASIPISEDNRRDLSGEVSGGPDILKGTDEHVLQHTPRHDQPGATIHEIMKRCGYKSYDHTRKALRRLREDRKVDYDGKRYNKAKDVS